MKTYILISILSFLLFTGCGSNENKTGSEASVYSPPQPTVDNIQERPPTVPSI